MQDVAYAATAPAAQGVPITNTSTPQRDRWRELTYASYADALTRAGTAPLLREYLTDNADLARFRSGNRKMILWNGLAEDVIPAQGAVNWYERVKAGVGGEAQVQQFLRLYNIPGMAHSSQGRAWTVANTNNVVPMPALPGNANQTPSREQDPLFSALIGILIVWSSWRLIRESTNVLLEGTPAHINLAAVEDSILRTEGVDNVHDLHVWTITSGREALSAHVIHGYGVSQPELLKELRAKLHDRFGVDHLTIQMETPDFEDETFHFCHAGTACFQSSRPE